MNLNQLTTWTLFSNSSCVVWSFETQLVQTQGYKVDCRHRLHFWNWIDKCRIFTHLRFCTETKLSVILFVPKRNEKKSISISVCLPFFSQPFYQNRRLDDSETERLFVNAGKTVRVTLRFSLSTILIQGNTFDNTNLSFLQSPFQINACCVSAPENVTGRHTTLYLAAPIERVKLRGRQMSSYIFTVVKLQSRSIILHCTLRLKCAVLKTIPVTMCVLVTQPKCVTRAINPIKKFSFKFYSICQLN